MRFSKKHRYLFLVMIFASTVLTGCSNSEEADLDNDYHSYQQLEEFDDTRADSPIIPPLINGAHHWSFDDDLGGAAAVASRNNNQNVNPLLRGDVPRVPGRNDGYVAHFTGRGGGLYLGNNIITGDTYTISFWANPHMITDWTAMFFAGNHPNHLSIVPRNGGGSTNAFLVPGHQWHFNTGVIPIREWTHIAFTADGDVSRFYINGQLADTVTNPVDIFTGGPLSQFFLGVTLFDDPAFVGYIDDLFILPETALSVGEIRDLAGITYDDNFIMPGANTVYNDPEKPIFVDTSIHDPSLTRTRASDGWFYAIGTDLGSARTRDFMTWESLNDGRGYARRNNENNHYFFPLDNPDRAVETMENQFEYIGAFHNPDRTAGTRDINNVVFWASEIIEVDGRFFKYYTLAGGIGEWDWAGRDHQMPQAGLGLAIADSIDGPWITQGIFIRGGYSNRYYNDERVPFNHPSGMNMAMVGGVPFDPDIHPNPIDPSPFICSNGDLWLVYGSYGGGIFLLELDRTTGLPVAYEDSEINSANDGFGTLLIASTHNYGEGPHMIYSETSGYYYLFQTFGWLASYGGYNVRMWRSASPYGPFEDARFSQAHVQRDPHEHHNTNRWVDVDGTEFARNAMGIKLIGGYQFINAPNERGLSTGYLSPGHGGLIRYDNRYLKVFHTRFIGRWEWHQVRVHEMLMNCNGWFVMAPLRFDGGQAVREFDKLSLVGDYKIINHGRDNNGTAHQSLIYRFNSDGLITDATGANVGNWSLSGTNIANITLHDLTFNGVFLRQYDEESSEWVQTFTAVSYDLENSGLESTAGLSLWGKGVSAGSPYSR